jgi:hypothetical protein
MIPSRIPGPTEGAEDAKNNPLQLQCGTIDAIKPHP